MSDKFAPTDAAARFFARLFRVGLSLGALGMAASIVGALIQPALFFRAWLYGMQFWLGMSLGCIAILMMHYLMGGAWGVATRRLFEAGARTMPLLALLFIPLLFGLPSLYPWARPADVAGDPVLLHNAAYLNSSFFTLRAVLYFLIWSAFAIFLGRWSRQQDITTDSSPTRKMEALSGPGLVLLIVSGSFAWMDWLMSLEPHWYSSIYPIMVLAGQGLSSMAFGVIIAVAVSDDAELAPVLTPARFHDLGTLLFTFVFFWAYLCYAQFIIIWSGNLTHEIPWYLARTVGGWSTVTMSLFVLAFAIPFFLLLFRHVKRDRHALRRVALLCLVMQMVNAYWLSAAPFQTAGPEFHWQYPAALLGIGGLWLAAYAWLAHRQPLLPVRAPGYPDVRPQSIVTVVAGGE